MSVLRLDCCIDAHRDALLVSVHQSEVVLPAVYHQLHLRFSNPTKLPPCAVMAITGLTVIARPPIPALLQAHACSMIHLATAAAFHLLVCVC